MPGVVGLTKFIIRLVHNAGDVTLVTSPQLKEELESFGVKRVHVWKKGIDTERFNPLFKSGSMRARLTEGHPEDPLLIYVGRLGAEKKLKTLRCVFFWLRIGWLIGLVDGAYKRLPLCWLITPHSINHTHNS